MSHDISYLITEMLLETMCFAVLARWFEFAVPALFNPAFCILIQLITVFTKMISFKIMMIFAIDPDHFLDRFLLA
jgi:hypothetical protein